MVGDRKSMHSQRGYKPIMRYTPDISEMTDGIPQFSIEDGVLYQYFSFEKVLYVQKIGPNINYMRSLNIESAEDQTCAFSSYYTGVTGIDIGASLPYMIPIVYKVAPGFTNFNKLGVYDINNGRFVAPEVGSYYIEGSVKLGGLSAGITYIRLHLYHLTKSGALVNGDALKFYVSPCGVDVCSISRIFSMAKGETIHLALSSDDSSGTANLISMGTYPALQGYRCD